MHTDQLERLQQWFTNYVRAFYTDGADKFLDSHVRLKEEHTARVCGQMRFLTDELELSEEDANLAQAAALLHDVGRFEQIQKYRTYVDPKSVNHSLLGVEILKREHVLEDLEAEDREILIAAVQWHGAKDLPEDLEGQTALICKLIRDADKLDVLPLLVNSFTRYYADPEHFDLEVEFPDAPRVSGHVIDALMSNQLVDYARIETLHDAQLVLLGWVFDITFTPSLKRIADKGYLEQIAAFLPDFPEVQRAIEHVFLFMQQKIEGNV